MQTLDLFDSLSTKQLDLICSALKSYSLNQFRVYLETKNIIYKENEKMLDELERIFKERKRMLLIKDNQHDN